MTADRDDNLTWLAYQYVANELDVAGRQDFEARLADDQDARDALADVVLIHQALDIAPTETAGKVAPATNARPRPTRPAGAASARTSPRFVIPAVTALALLVVVSLLMQPDPAENVAENGADSAAAPVAIAPGDNGPADDASSLIVLWHDLHADEELAEGDTAGFVDETAPATEAIPDWMFVALNASDEAPTDLDEMDMENGDGPWPADTAEEQL
ncbi:hypothetical protein [Maioricimonas sp. JC845]|uniref:hypothetical protein n=1 Tax=Maioricimonas sp. JC845 TaxID=3232138 RepID=UPI003459A95A